MVELLDKRTFTQKQFRVDNIRKQMKAHIGHIHYRDGALKNGAFQDVDTLLNYNNVSQTYSMTNASYEAEVGLLGSVRFHNINHSIEFALTNPNSVQAEPYLNSKFGSLGKGLIWKNIIQPGGHQIVETRNGSLAKIFRFESVPNSNVITFSVSISGGVKLLRNDVELRPLLQEIRTSDVLNLEYSGQLSWLRKPRAWNHRDEYTDIELRWYRSGTTIYVDKIIPQSFINNTFTEQGAWLECDTTTSYYTGAHDGNVWNSGADSTPWTTYIDATTGTAWGDTAVAIYIAGYDMSSDYNIRRAWFPVNTVAIGSGSVITAASWYMAGAMNHNQVAHTIAMVQSTQNPEVALANADYDSLVSIIGPDEGCTRINHNSIPNGSYLKTDLNSTGLSWINKTGWTKLAFRQQYDVDRNDPPASTFGYSYIYTSEQTGTNLDPYLQVEYTEFPVYGMAGVSQIILS